MHSVGGAQRTSRVLEKPKTTEVENGAFLSTSKPTKDRRARPMDMWRALRRLGCGPSPPAPTAKLKTSRVRACGADGRGLGATRARQPPRPSLSSRRRPTFFVVFAATSLPGQPTVRLPSPTPNKSSQLLHPSHILNDRLWCSAGQYVAGARRVRWQPPACSQIVWGSPKT